MPDTLWKLLKERDDGLPYSEPKEIISIILANRGVTKEEDWNTFVYPKHPSEWSWEALGVNDELIEKGLNLIQESRDNDKGILVYGDYDADGVTAGVIMSEYLDSIGVKHTLYLPDRKKDGYGMKVTALEKLFKEEDYGLVITVDQGIVAHEAVSFLKNMDVKVLLTDHHQAASILPDADVLIHSTVPSGSGLAWKLVDSWEKLTENSKVGAKTLELATIGTIADVMPLVEFNRSLVWHGLEAMKKSQRIGLQELYSVAQIDPDSLESHHLGFQIGPRINAAGRLRSAKLAADLLLSTNKQEAHRLAEELQQINNKRKKVTEVLIEKVKEVIHEKDKVIIVSGTGYEEGIIGLVAGKLVEEFQRPAVVLSELDGIAKASCRSIPGVNIVELLRSLGDVYVAVGGHEQAAGFSIKLETLPIFKKRLLEEAEQFIDANLLKRSLSIDCLIELDCVDMKLVNSLTKLAPFGMGNSTPVFISRKLQLIDFRNIGTDGNHLKLRLRSNSGQFWDVIGFGAGSRSGELHGIEEIDVVYKLGINEWNGRVSIQLMLLDFESKRGNV